MPINLIPKRSQEYYLKYGPPLTSAPSNQIPDIPRALKLLGRMFWTSGQSGPFFACPGMPHGVLWCKGVHQPKGALTGVKLAAPYAAGKMGLR
ncbi:MAG: hypothetical protein ACKPKO_16090, partial [Candidatus Fonsibacter sp.]